MKLGLPKRARRLLDGTRPEIVGAVVAAGIILVVSTLAKPLGGFVKDLDPLYVLIAIGGATLFAAVVKAVRWVRSIQARLNALEGNVADLTFGQGLLESALTTEQVVELAQSRNWTVTFPTPGHFSMHYKRGDGYEATVGGGVGIDEDEERSDAWVQGLLRTLILGNLKAYPKGLLSQEQVEEIKAVQGRAS